MKSFFFFFFFFWYGRIKSNSEWKSNRIWKKRCVFPSSIAKTWNVQIMDHSQPFSDQIERFLDISTFNFTISWKEWVKFVYKYIRTDNMQM